MLKHSLCLPFLQRNPFEEFQLPQHLEARRETLLLYGSRKKLLPFD